MWAGLGIGGEDVVSGPGTLGVALLEGRVARVGCWRLRLRAEEEGACACAGCAGRAAGRGGAAHVCGSLCARLASWATGRTGACGLKYSYFDERGAAA
eukprot:2202718-Prymnesium_polylepis.1